jgi:ADP-ribosyl-[dinitrogen reductase] hydrolase
MELQTRSRYDSELRHAIATAHIAGELLRSYFWKGNPAAGDEPADERIYSELSRVFPDYGYRGEEIGLKSKPKSDDTHLWLVDPQDGTSAASKGFRGAAVSIGLLRAGTPVLGVVYAYAAPDDRGDLFSWAEGLPSIYRNGVPTSRAWPSEPSVAATALVSQHADQAAEANAELVSPMRYRCVPGIACRLALVAAGEGDLAISVNWPTGWDVAAGHALLLGAGGDLFDADGKAIRYDGEGDPKSRNLSAYLGSSEKLVQSYTNRNWQKTSQRSPGPASEKLSFLSPGRLIKNVDVLSRAQGCLLGQLAGDSLGSLVEFKSPSGVRQLYPDGPRLLEDGGVWNTIAGQPTDDSELALSLARAIVHHKTYKQEAVAAAYADWFGSHPF